MTQSKSVRIVLSCLQSLEHHPLPAYAFWRHYFVQGCREAGIEYVEVPGIDWAEGLLYPAGASLNDWRARTWEAVLEFVRREHARQRFDFFLAYLYPQQVEIAAIAELQRIGIPSVNYFCDNVREFHRVPAEYRPFALHWVPEFEALPLYRKAGLAHLHLPMPCWVPPELRTVPTAETEQPTFIGSPDILRRDLLGQALQAGGDFVVRGPGWATDSESAAGSRAALRPTSKLITNQIRVLRAHGVKALYHKMEARFRPLRPPAISEARIGSFLSNSEYIRVTREAVVTIGVNRVPTARASNHHPLSYSRLRDLEAPMLGACYLTEWTEGIGHLYEIGAEIETYRNADELAAKLKGLRDDPARRRSMREMGQRRALAEHTVARSLGRMCETLNIK